MAHEKFRHENPLLERILNWDHEYDPKVESFRSIVSDALDQYPTLIRPENNSVGLLQFVENKLRGKPLYYFPIDDYFTAQDIQGWLTKTTPSIGQMEVTLEYVYQGIESHERRS